MYGMFMYFFIIVWQFKNSSFTNNLFENFAITLVFDAFSISFV